MVGGGVDDMTRVLERAAVDLVEQVVGVGEALVEELLAELCLAADGAHGHGGDPLGADQVGACVDQSGAAVRRPCFGGLAAVRP